MVLQDATASPASTGDTFTSDNSDATSDTYDPYAYGNSSDAFPSDPSSSSPTPQSYILDVSKLPSPIPLIGPLTGFSSERRRQAITHAHSAVSAAVQRPLTSEECDAVAYHMAKGAAIHSWGYPLGVAGATWRFNATRAEFRFPFYKPDLATMNRDKFLGLRGWRAQWAWQIARACSYGFIGTWLGRSMMGAYAATTVAVGQMRDRRLKDVREELQSKGEQEGRVRGRPQRGPQGQGQQQPQHQQQRQQQQRQSDYGDGNELAQGYGGVQASGDIEGADARGFSYDSDYDDASPTASPSPQSQARGGSGSSGGGSAWDKLRGGAQTPNAWAERRRQDLGSQTKGQGPDQGRIRQEQRMGATTGDSYTFSSSEAERAEAKAQSQREFDERVERERQGRDFADEGGNGKWR